MDGFMVHCCKCDSGFEIDPDNVMCPKCATQTGGTQPTDVQQLNVAIALWREALDAHRGQNVDAWFWDNIDRVNAVIAQHTTV